MEKYVMTRKRLYITVAAVLIIIITFVLVVPHLKQPTPVYKAKIIGFIADGPYPIAGVTMIVTFNISVENVGANLIPGLNITLVRSINGTVDNSAAFDYRNQNFTLSANQTLSELVYYTYNLPQVNVPVPHEEFLAKLYMGDTVLDERYL
jgi:hypothetical protein